MLLGLPIGMFLHLVFDGAWNNTDVFWWPFTGWAFDDDPLPELDRGLLTLVMEVARASRCVRWVWRANNLSSRRRPARLEPSSHDGRTCTLPHAARLSPAHEAGVARSAAC